MRYQVFGKTGMNVSRITLGTWGMGGVGWDKYDDSTRMDAIAAAVEGGINFIDTAPAYNGGAAERLLGKALKELGMRDKVYISTKCGNQFVDGVIYKKDSSPAALRMQLEQSLKNLQTDHVDLLLIHWPDANTPFEETMGELNRMKEEGKVLHIGVSNFSRQQMEEISRFGDIEAYQPPYSMVQREQEAQIRWAHEQGMGVMSYGSLGGGILTGRYRTCEEYAPSDSRNRFYKHFHEPMFSKVMKVVDVMDEVSAENGNVPLSWIALNWSLSKNFIDTCIVGAQSRKRVEENCRAMDFTLPLEDIEKLNKAVETYLA